MENTYDLQKTRAGELPEFHLGQEVNTPDGTGIIVEMDMPSNGLYISPERAEAVVWYGTGNGKGGAWWKRVYRLSELSPSRNSVIEISGIVEKYTRTDKEIVEQTNELARQFYRLHDRGGSAEKGFRFDLSEHPQEQQCWKMACEAQELLTQTDVQDALDNLEDE